MMGSRVILVSVVAAALFSGCYGCGNDVTPTAVGATATGTPIPTPIAEPSSASQATPAHPLPGLESRAGLDHLLICVDVSPAAIPAMRATEAAALVAASVPSYARLYGLANDAFRDAGAQPYPALKNPEVRPGCPDGYLPPPEKQTGLVKEPVTSASRFPLHLFIVTDAEIGGVIRAGEKYLRRGYEQICSGHTCAEVTTALYVPLSQIRMPATVGFAIADGTGITPILRYPCGHPDPAPKCQGIQP